MTLEKLQKISASLVQPEYKIKWLNWWNSREMNREVLRFPPSPVTEIILESWLMKVVFWAEVNILG
jgi:hypothetical protein